MDFNGIQCFYTNADSLPNKLGELMSRIQDGKNSYEVNFREVKIPHYHDM
jgi:hypothetical protein